MDWMQVIGEAADLPLRVLLLIAVVVLYLENRKLREQIVAILQDTRDTSADNNNRIRRIEREQLGDNSPTLPKKQM